MKVQTPSKDEIKVIRKIVKKNGVFHCTKGRNKHSPAYTGSQTAIICDTVYKNIVKQLNEAGFFVEGQNEHQNFVDVLLVWKMAE